jgi:hypothetical protein
MQSESSDPASSEAGERNLPVVRKELLPAVIQSMTGLSQEYDLLVERQRLYARQQQEALLSDHRDLEPIEELLMDHKEVEQHQDRLSWMAQMTEQYRQYLSVSAHWSISFSVFCPQDTDHQREETVISWSEKTNSVLLLMPCTYKLSRMRWELVAALLQVSWASSHDFVRYALSPSMAHLEEFRALRQREARTLASILLGYHPEQAERLQRNTRFRWQQQRPNNNSTEKGEGVS